MKRSTLIACSLVAAVAATCASTPPDGGARAALEARSGSNVAGEVLFSPSHHQVDARQLADWIVADNLPVRLQLQLHKILWNDEPGH